MGLALLRGSAKSASRTVPAAELRPRPRSAPVTVAGRGGAARGLETSPGAPGGVPVMVETHGFTMWIHVVSLVYKHLTWELKSGFIEIFQTIF